MNLPIVKDFFSNKVTIQLKNGHKFQGLLSSINYKKLTIILQDVQDLGNSTDKNFIPHDKKIVEKIFQSDNIEQIFFKQKHFCQPKKYNKDDFWDATSEPVAQTNNKVQKKQYNNNGGYHQKRNYDNNRDNNRDTRGGRRQNYNNNYNYNNNRNYNNRDRQYKNYQEKTQYKRRDQKYQKKQKQADDRDYR